MKVVSHYPSFFTREEGMQISKPISLEEMESVLTKFDKYKIPRLDGWPMELFISFFNIMGRDMLVIVEMSRSQGVMSRTLNSTFIYLIPKKEKLDIFSNFLTDFSL